MAKINREKVIVESTLYHFDEKYANALEYFDDKKVISISVISSKVVDFGNSIREEFIVFYEELPKESEVVNIDSGEIVIETENEKIESGDLVYYLDVNTSEKLYMTVEKVIFEDGINKCCLEEDGTLDGGGFVELSKVTLVSKAKDRKDV